MLTVLVADVCCAQTCLVRNPSFEVRSGLDGWTTVNDVGFETRLFAHGTQAISIGTPGGNEWSLSSVWQGRDASPGTVFNGTVRVGHTAADPLTGDARGIVNIEWRDASDNLIDFESFEVLHPDDPTGRMPRRSFTTGPAPSGTASARLLLGTLQSPAGETGRTVFDVVELTEPDYDDIQWVDFPGGRRIEFGGHTWRVKGPGFYGPGPNTFSDSTENVDVTPDGLSMNITGSSGQWRSSEVTIEEPLGYGDYVFTTRGKVDAIADNVVLGMFLWQYPRCWQSANEWNQHNEIDVEVSRWNDPFNINTQFVTQPYTEPENIERFDIVFADDELVSYAFNWLPGRVEYRAWRGGPEDESPATMIHEWTYADEHLPTPEQPRVHINLWYYGPGPIDGNPQSVTIADFRFRAMADTDGDGRIRFSDVVTFIRMLRAKDPAADLNNDGSFDALDQMLFVFDGLGVG